jgi:hypothetical protein
MGGPFQRPRLVWNRFWFEPQPPHAQALFRVMFGVFLLIYWLLRAPHVSFLFTTDGLYIPLFDPPAGGLAAVHRPGDLIGWLTAPVSPWIAWWLYAALIASLVLFTLGWWTRAAAIAQLLLYAYFHHVQLYTLNASFDRLLLQVSLLMCASRCDEVISLRAWRRRRAGLPVGRPVPAWPARLIALQMTAVYLGTGVNKLVSPAWHGGEILYYNFIGYWGSDLAFWIARAVPWMIVYDVLVYATIAFEVSAPIGLYVRRLQPWYFVFGLGFHTMIAVTLQIWQFLAMPAGYVLYLDPARVQRAWESLTRRAGSPMQPP